MENIVTRRYYWQTKSDDKKVNFKIISDVLQAHDQFISAIKSEIGDELDKFSYEYLHEYDVAKLGSFVNLLVNNDVSEEI